MTIFTNSNTLWINSLPRSVKPGVRVTRDELIRRDYQAGERIPLLERRYQLKQNELWAIINRINK